MVLEGLGGILGGVGLFLVGMRLLSESMKSLASRRLRVLAVRWMPNRFAAAGWGMLTLMIIQTMPTLTFITVSMKQSGLISTKRAFSIILGGNAGSVLVLLILVLDVKLFALYALGIAGIVMVVERIKDYRQIATGLFGISMLFLGLVLVREYASPLAEESWFSEVLGWMEISLWFSFLGAIALTLIAQSFVLTVALGVSMATIGVMTIDQAMMVTFGACIGSSLMLLILSANFTGTSRQIAMFQVAFNFIACLIFVPLFLFELNSGIPLLKALATAIDTTLSHQVVIFALLYVVLAALLLLAVLTPTVRLYERLWPATKEEEMSRPRYIHDRAFGALDMALRLVDLEQRRLLPMFSEYFDAVRREEPIDRQRETVRSLMSRIDEFLEEAKPRYLMGWTEGFNSALTRQKLLTWLEEQLTELCTELTVLPGGSTLGGLKSSFVEGIDTVFLILDQELSAGHEDSWSNAAELTGDRSELMRRMRATYMSGDIELSEAEQVNLFNITNSVEQIFFLLSKLTEETQSARDLVAEAPAGE